MSIQEKFDKAVNVIRNLPKNGSYQPSHELQLRFYAYYKQATEGFNYHPRPSFWEVVKRAKWDAWAKLGNMTKEEAMIHYVEELRKIVETMSYTDNVANFLNSLDNFYEHVPAEDLELLVGPIIEKIQSRPNSPLSGSPLASRDTSPSRATGLSRDSSPLRLNAKAVVHNTSKHITSSLETSPASSYSASPLPPDTDDEEEDEHFLDTQTEPDRGSFKKNRTDNITVEDETKEAAVTQEFLRLHTVNSHQGLILSGKRSCSEVLSTDLTNAPETIQTTISIMRKDMDEMKSRLQSVENTLTSQSKQITCSMFESYNGSVQGDQGSKSSSAAVPEAFKITLETMKREMEILQERMASLEHQKQQELALSHRRTSALVPRWWRLPVRDTIILFGFPFLILFITKWLRNRRRR